MRSVAVQRKRALPDAATAAEGKGRGEAAPRLAERNCSVARTVGILSDAWAFLVIREAFFGARRFKTFMETLGLPRATLTERLKRLTQQGIFRSVRYSDTSQRVEYRLTNMGLELYPSFIALMQFGDRWLSPPEGPPLRLLHSDCGCDCRPIVACSACLEGATAAQVTYRDGPGAGYTAVKPTKRARRSSDPSQFLRGRPSSVSRTLQLIGDRWSFLIIREAFFGARRFDRLQTELNIASNILTDRLARLVATGIFERHKYQSQPDRFEYRLTDMGKDLYGSLIMMMSWGDRWLSRGGPPLILTHHACGKDFTPVVICDRCRKPIDPHAMRYQINYDARAFGIPDANNPAVAGRI